MKRKNHHWETSPSRRCKHHPILGLDGLWDKGRRKSLESWSPENPVPGGEELLGCSRSIFRRQEAARLLRTRRKKERGSQQDPAGRLEAELHSHLQDGSWLAGPGSARAWRASEKGVSPDADCQLSLPPARESVLGQETMPSQLLRMNFPSLNYFSFPPLFFFFLISKIHPVCGAQHGS